MEPAAIFDEKHQWYPLKKAADIAGVNYKAAYLWVTTNRVAWQPAPRSSGSKYKARPIDLIAYEHRQYQPPLPGIPDATSQKKNTA